MKKIKNRPKAYPEEMVVIRALFLVHVEAETFLEAEQGGGS